MTTKKEIPPGRSAIRFGLRVLLLVVLCACLVFAWIGWRIRAANEQQRAIAEIKRVGGSVNYDFQRKPGTGSGRQVAVFSDIEPPSSWQRRVFGDSFVDSVVAVDLETGRATDADLARLSAFAELEYLSVNGKGVTDAGVRHLTCLSKLRVLSLQDTRITDEGLLQLATLKNLIGLGIINCDGVSDDAISELEGKLPNCFVSR